METMSSFIDCSKSGHDAPHFIAGIIGFNRKFIYDFRELCELKVRRHLVGYKENSFFAIPFVWIDEADEIACKNKKFYRICLPMAISDPFGLNN